MSNFRSLWISFLVYKEEVILAKIKQNSSLEIHSGWSDNHWELSSDAYVLKKHIFFASREKYILKEKSQVPWGRFFLDYNFLAHV